MEHREDTKKGYLFIVSGPSGVGKTVLCNEIVDKYSPKVVYSISATSREPRGGEKDGQEYFFFTPEEFKRKIEENKFAEWAFVHGNYYGTSKSFLERNINEGKHVILNIDVQGALKICKEYPEAIMVFILPPSLEELENRIRKRNMDSEDALRNRLENARRELEFKDKYTYSIINDDLNRAIKELSQIFEKYVN
jgi:guanylate kinase